MIATIAADVATPDYLAHPEGHLGNASGKFRRECGYLHICIILIVIEP